MTWFLIGTALGVLFLVCEANRTPRWKRMECRTNRILRARLIVEIQPIYLDSRAGPDVEHAIRIMDAYDFQEDAGLILTLEEPSTN